MNIRSAGPSDAGQIAAIYNYYIENTHNTFETVPISSSEMSGRILAISEKYPFLVILESDEILGYAYACAYKPRQAYRHSVEISVYVKNDVYRRGIGRKLYKKLFEELSAFDVHAIIAGIALPNAASVNLHEGFGFKKVAHFQEVGYKLDRWIDVGYWELVV
jgi:L-amino acid N-acyltransferase YncA